MRKIAFADSKKKGNYKCAYKKVRNNKNYNFFLQKKKNKNKRRVTAAA